MPRLEGRSRHLRKSGTDGGYTGDSPIIALFDLFKCRVFALNETESRRLQLNY